MPALSATQKIQIVDKVCRYIPHAVLQGICLEGMDQEEVTLRLPLPAGVGGQPRNRRH